MALRQQTAVEFLFTYSFAIFMVTIILALAAALSFYAGSTPPIYSTCSIQPLIPCQQTILTYNAVTQRSVYTLIFRNDLGYVMNFSNANQINLTFTELASGTIIHPRGTCYPTLADEGAEVICKVVVNGVVHLHYGTDTYSQFRLYYGLCTVTASTLNCNGVYNSTGYSYQTLDSPYYNLYNVTLYGANGVILVNGQPYFSNSVIYLSGGTYQIYAQPSSGYAVGSPIWYGNGITPSNSLSQYTNVIVSQNANLTANFIT